MNPRSKKNRPRPNGLLRSSIRHPVRLQFPAVDKCLGAHDSVRLADPATRRSRHRPGVKRGPERISSPFREQHDSSVSNANPIEAEALEWLGYPAPAREENRRKSLEDLQRRIKVLEAALPIQEKARQRVSALRRGVNAPRARLRHIFVRTVTADKESGGRAV